MNERIKELALQAGAVKVWEWASDDVLDTKNMDAEKFAELIVKECMTVGFNAVYNVEDDSNAIVVYTEIKQHFGVE
jgi:hypothetical protein